jgi:galactonate dehydratase
MDRRGFLCGAGTLLACSRVPRIASAQTAAGKAKALNLKITGVKPIVVNAGASNWVFCKVTTNQGLTGLGEGSVTSKEATLAQAITEHERFLVGKDPTDIELLWQAMYRYPRWRGGPILNSAISAVEIALWDILGKALGVPIYKLLGGAARARIRLYVDIPPTPEAFSQAKADGFSAAKAVFVAPESETLAPSAAVREAARKVEAARKAVGEDFDVAVEAHGRLTPPMALDFCHRIEDLRPLWVEEPVQVEDLD